MSDRNNRILMKYLIILMAVFCSQIAMPARTSSQVEGVVIKHIPSRLERYIGSPSICIMPDGTYLASHDEFGPSSSEFKAAVTRVYSSEDNGLTWKQISQINGQFWSSLFLVDNDVYIIGTNKHHGNFVIRKSFDGGKTWTIPYDEKNGLILEGEYHTAPVPVVVYKGRIWRALEYATSKTLKWGERYSAMVASAPVNSDLLDRKNWRISNRIGRDASLLNGNFQAWLEGNVVVAPSGELLDILRVNTFSPEKEKAAVVHVNSNGRKIKFNGEFLEFPGASKKFTIRYDTVSGKYISLVNYDDHSHPEINSSKIRNNLVLAVSDNLKSWTVCKSLLYKENYSKYGFQYVDWLFDGDDIIFVCRTATDEKDGKSAHNSHDANYLTFHRIMNFRSLFLE